MSKISFIIHTPAIFSFAECLWFLDRRLDDCMHTVTGKSVLKLLSIDDKPVLLEISGAGDGISVTVLKGATRNTGAIKEFIEEWFDLDRNIAPFYKLLDKDPELKHLKKNYYGLHIVGIPDFFELLCWCVIGQQINLTFAYKVKRRLVELYGQSLTHDGKKHYIFPSPEVIAQLTIEDLRAHQLTTRKAEYLIGIAQLFNRGELSKNKIQELGDEKLMLQELMKIRGIGEWTANYVIMKGLRAMNGIPYGDSGVNQALFNLKGIPKKNNRDEVDVVFNKFRNWKTYLVFYLWRSLRNEEPT